VGFDLNFGFQCHGFYVVDVYGVGADEKKLIVKLCMVDDNWYVL
jgi:hypothetical protein